MNHIQTVLFRVVAAALAFSLISVIPLKRGVRRVLNAACGALLLLILLGPVLKLRGINPVDLMKRFRTENSLIDEALQDSRNQTRALITEQTTAYILDKAADLGAQVRAEVTLAALSEHYQYPYAVHITGRWTGAQRQALSEYISQTLGIPPERQTWEESAS